jgi:hypothetical protein
MPESKAESPSDRPSGEDDKKQASELEVGIDQLGKVFGGVMTRLLGAGVTGRATNPERSVLGAEADRTVDQVGDTVGRFLKAAGESLKAHPTDPIQVVGETLKHSADPVEAREGEAPLTEGIRSLAGGLYKTTEAILDLVAPRKPKGEAGEAGEADDSDGPDGDGPEGETRGPGVDERPAGDGPVRG